MSESTANLAKLRKHRRMGLWPVMVNRHSACCSKPSNASRFVHSTACEAGRLNADNAKILFDIAGRRGDLPHIKPAAPLLACVIRRVFFCPDAPPLARERRIE